MFSSNSTQVSSAANYIEDVFSTWLYTGNGSTQTITNGIDLAGQGGMTWIKSRSAATDHKLIDTVRGATKALISDTPAIQTTDANGLTTFNSTGFSIGTDSVYNTNAATYASWTFRKQPKFFDVVTYTGTGSARTIAHSLGVAPGMVIVKRTDTTGNWQVYSNGLTSAAYSIQLNLSAAQASAPTVWNSTAPTSSVFSVGTDATVNASGGTYVAYVFAHDASASGLMQCGAWTQSASPSQITLGWEPQWILVKKTNAVDPWQIVDTMRGWSNASSGSELLYPNTSAAAAAATKGAPNATGFTTSGWGLNPGDTAIYLAIRRGPMKVPTDGTKVFSPNISSGATGTAITTNFPVDMQIGKYRAGAAANAVVDRLRGVSTTSTEVGSELSTSSAAAEGTASGADSRAWGNTGFQMPINLGGISDIFWNFRRAPGFFDVVCYTGTGSATTVTHNLAAVPELMIFKRRNSARSWAVYAQSVGASSYANLEKTNPFYSGTQWNNTAPTASVVSLGADGNVNTAASTYVAYLFASCPGVSKVGSYTGTGATQTINCGFTGGARFVLIKRTDSTGSWYVWDVARGISSGNDPYLLLNSTAAEVTNTDYIDAYSAGFEISSTAPAEINASGGSFIFFAVS